MEYKELNGIKGISALVIACLYHYRNICSVACGKEYVFEDVLIIDWFSKYGLFLVELFFIISGFLFVHAYEDKIAKKSLKFEQFMLGRIIRIYPSMILSTSFLFLLESIWYKQNGYNLITQSTVWSYILNITGFQCWISNILVLNGPVWYISVLMFCYIVAFIIAKTCRSFIYLIPVIMSFGISYAGVNTFIFNEYIARGMRAFFIGCILYKCKDKIGEKMLTIFEVLLVMYICLHWVMDDYFFDAELYILTVFVYPIVILSCIRRKIFSILRLKFFQFIGNISFSVYLYNLGLLWCLRAINERFNIFNPERAFVWGGCLIAHIIIAWIFTKVDRWIVRNIKESLSNK